MTVKLNFAAYQRIIETNTMPRCFEPQNDEAGFRLLLANLEELFLIEAAKYASGKPYDTTFGTFGIHTSAEKVLFGEYFDYSIPFPLKDWTLVFANRGKEQYVFTIPNTEWNQILQQVSTY